MRIDWTQYQPGGFYDELFAAPGTARPSAAQLADYLASLGDRELAERQADAERAIVEMGITFTVYTEGQNIDRAWPFDVIPRTIEATEWARTERGPEAAAERAQSLHRRPLPRPARSSKTGSCPTTSSRRRSNFLAGLRRRRSRHTASGRTSAARDLVRDARRHDLRAGGQPARAVRRVVHAREPQRDEARVPGTVRAPRRSCPSTTTRRSCSTCSRRCRRARSITREIVVLTPGIYNSRLFRALRISRSAWASNSSRARSRRRRRRLRLHAHDPRPRARRRHLSAHRRHVPRSRSPSTRIPCSACRA